MSFINSLIPRHKKSAGVSSRFLVVSPGCTRDTCVGIGSGVDYLLLKTNDSLATTVPRPMKIKTILVGREIASYSDGLRHDVCGTCLLDLGAFCLAEQKCPGSHRDQHPLSKDTDLGRSEFDFGRLVLKKRDWLTFRCCASRYLGKLTRFCSLTRQVNPLFADRFELSFNRRLLTIR